MESRRNRLIAGKETTTVFTFHLRAGTTRATAWAGREVSILPFLQNHVNVQRNAAEGEDSLNHRRPKAADSCKRSMRRTSGESSRTYGLLLVTSSPRVKLKPPFHSHSRGAHCRSPYFLCFEYADTLEAYSIPSKTGLLIPTWSEPSSSKVRRANRRKKIKCTLGFRLRL